MKTGYILGIVAILALAGAAYLIINNNTMGTTVAEKLEIPSSIRHEHEELHEQLALARSAGGQTAQAAEEVEKVLKPHFEAEEEFAMLQLGSLQQVARGEAVDNAQIISLSEKLKAEMPKMLNEHKAITAALDKLQQAAVAENKAAQAQFAQQLKLHALNEEQVLYPSAIIVGEYLKLKG